MKLLMERYSSQILVKSICNKRCLQEGEFPGLIPLINNYLSGMDVDADTHCTIQQYLKFIQKRAAGDILTTASWIRNFVMNHSDYKYVFSFMIK